MPRDGTGPTKAVMTKAARKRKHVKRELKRVDVLRQSEREWKCQRCDTGNAPARWVCRKCNLPIGSARWHELYPEGLASEEEATGAAKDKARRKRGSGKTKMLGSKKKPPRHVWRPRSRCAGTKRKDRERPPKGGSFSAPFGGAPSTAAGAGRERPLAGGVFSASAGGASGGSSVESRAPGVVGKYATRRGTTKGERAESGLHRQGKGFRSPYAHIGFAASAGAVAVGAAGLRFLWKASDQAASAVGEVLDGAASALRSLTGVVEEVGSSMREGISVTGISFAGFGRIIAKILSSLESLVPAVVALAVTAVVMLLALWLWTTGVRAVKGLGIRAGVGCRSPFAQAARSSQPERFDISEGSSSSVRELTGMFSRWNLDAEQGPGDRLRGVGRDDTETIGEGYPISVDVLAREIRSYPKALTLASGQAERIKRLPDSQRADGGKLHFLVPSERDTGLTYLVRLRPPGMANSGIAYVCECECLDHKQRGPVCKHAGALLLALRHKNAPGPPARAKSMPRQLRSMPDVKEHLKLAEAMMPDEERRTPERRGRSVQVRTPQDDFQSPLEGSERREGERPEADPASSRTASGAPRARASSKELSPGALEQLRGKARSSQEGIRKAAPTVRKITAPHPKDNGVVGELGEALKVMGAVEFQEEAIRRIGMASGVVLLFAYGFDRRDIAAALVEAKARGVQVRCGFDRRTALSGTPRDMTQIARELDGNGVEIRLLNGVSVADEYRAVNRDVVGRGIQHAKCLLVDNFLVVGSCNWTTSSRCNMEMNVLVRVKSECQPLVQAMFEERLTLGTRWREDPGVQTRTPFEQQGTRRSTSRSASTGRYGRSYSLDPAQLISYDPKEIQDID